MKEMCEFDFERKKEWKDKEKANETNNCAGGTDCFGDGKEKRMIDDNKGEIYFGTGR